MPVTIREFGEIGGAPARLATLSSDRAEVTVASWGASLIDWRVAGDPRPMIYGPADPADLPRQDMALNAIVGRVANRVRGARFPMGGTEVRVDPNLGPHVLHGGATGFARRPWRLEADGEAARLTLESPAGEGGWPAAVVVEVLLRLDGARLTWDMTATVDGPTPLNLAQHVYFTLGAERVTEGVLQVAADHALEVDGDLLPTGRLVPVAGGRLDFRAPRPLAADGAGVAPDGGAAGVPLDDFLAGVPLDDAMVLTPRAPEAPAVTLTLGPRTLRLWTDRPSLQLFDVPDHRIGLPGRDGRPLGPFGALCLEAQGFPDAVNNPAFPPAIHTPDRPYRQTTTVEIA